MDAADSRTEVQGRIEALTLAITVRSLPYIVGSLMKTRLTVPQFKVLASLAIGEEDTPSGLSRSLSVTLATMSKTVDRLVAQDLVVRIADPEDRRVRRLRLTSLGRSVVEEVMAPRPELGPQMLARLSLEELASLEVGLGALSRELHTLAAPSL